MSDFDFAFKKWIDCLLDQERWEPLVDVDPGYPERTIDSVRKMIKNSESFEKQVRELATSFEVDIEDPYVFGHFQKRGYKIGAETEQILLELHLANLKHRDFLRSEITTLKLPINQRKRGPRSEPDFLAIATLIAFELAGTSRRNREKVRDFFSPDGVLAKWLSTALPVPDEWPALDELIKRVCDHSHDDTSAWVSKRRQTLERLLISKKLGPKSRAHPSYGDELRALKLSIKGRTEKFRTR